MGAEKRQHRRSHVAQPALIVDGDGSTIGTCLMLDVSAGGARLKLTDEVAVPEEFTLLLSKFDKSVRRRCAFVWKKKNQLGVRFFPD
jgi:hypothetical protein